eukprot:37789-Eustigmatos_ZCMA.PRE.1
MSSASLAVHAMGFSTSTCLPASKASIACSLGNEVGGDPGVRAQHGLVESGKQRGAAYLWNGCSVPM